MQTYKIVIAYDGTAYHGWQVQPEAITVAGMLERRFKDVFKIPIKLIGASRTDAGVHALGQVASFSLESHIPAQAIEFAWNNALPQDILIRSVSEAPADFHPQRHVKEKTYHYYFFDTQPLPFIGRYGYYHGAFHRDTLVEALQVFVGTHDFRSFCTGYEQESTVRTINNIKVQCFRRYGVYRIVVRGPGFLRYMIRRIVGACLEVASSQFLTIADLQSALDAKNPSQNLLVAPPRGLVLYGIEYSNTFIF